MNENPPIPPPDSGPVDQASAPENPPLTPEASTVASASEAPPVILTSDAQHHLSQTGPWVRFLSIMLFIGAAFLILAGISLVLMGLAGLDSSLNSMGSGPLPSGAIIFLGPIYIVMAFIIYIVPGIFLFRYASAIKRLKVTPSAQALEDALKYQKTFWRYLGITAIIMLCIFMLAVMAALFFAVILAMRS